MMNNQTLARPYARAAFEYSNEAGSVAAWSGLLALCNAALAVPALAEQLKDPRLARDRKLALLVAALGDEAMDPAFRNFLATLNEHDRLFLMPEVQRAFEALKAEAERTLDVELETAFELDGDQLQTLTAALSKRLDRTVNPVQVVNPALIGGLLIRAGDVVVDGSVRGKLSQLAESLKS